MSKIRWQIAINHQAYVEVYSADRWFALHSRYDPQKEAQKNIQNQKRVALYIVWGSGALYFAKALAFHAPEARIQVYEPCKELFNSPEHQALRAECLKANQNITINLYDPATTNSILASTYQPSIDTSVQVIEHPVYNVIFSQETAVFMGQIRQEIDTAYNDYRTQSVFGRRWLYCLSYNLSYYLHNPQSLLSTSKISVPQKVVVIGAGPSLDLPDSLDRLPSFKADYLISTDTSLNWCYKHNLKPMAIASIDAQAISLRHLIGIPQKPELAFLDPTCHPAYFRFFSNPFVLASAHPLYQAILYFADYSCCGYQSGGNVGQSIIDILLGLGVSQIYAGGLDFAYSGQKPYIRPSLLDSDFHSHSERLCPAEQSYSGLWLADGIRTEQNWIQTPRLKDYHEAFLSMLKSHDAKMDSLNQTWKSIFKAQTARTNLPEYFFPEPKRIMKGLRMVIGQLKTWQTAVESVEWPHLVQQRNQPEFNWIAPVLASIQRTHIHLQENPADTLKEDISQACQATLAACHHVLEGF